MKTRSILRGKHNPWAYFSDPTDRRNCQNFDVPAGTPTGGALHDDVQAGTLPTVGVLIPNLCHDAHNCPLAAADAWLQQWLPLLIQGPDYRAGHLAIVITFDEDDNSGDNTVLTTVIAPTMHHVSAATPLTHYSLTRYLAELAASPPPGEAATAGIVEHRVRPVTLRPDPNARRSTRAEQTTCP